MLDARRLFALVWCAAAIGCSRSSSNTIVDGHARFQVLTSTLIRFEFADDRHFEDGTTFNRVKSDLPPVRFTTRVRDDWREIETDDVIVRWLRGASAFTRDNVTVEYRHQGWGLRWPFGPPPSGALGGWLRSLDAQGGPVTMHDALLDRDGWYLLDDTRTAVTGADGWVKPRSGHVGAYQDAYLFVYGNDYRRAFADYVKLSGPPPLLPRWAFGIWFSRYWSYADNELRKLVERFRADKVPLDVLVVDTDWKQPIPGQHPAPAWNSWEWNRSLFPDGNAFLKWAAGEGLAVTLNIHPSIFLKDPQFNEVNVAAGGLTRIENESYAWDWGNRKQAASYFALHEPFEDGGVRFWWLDACCESQIAIVDGVPAGKEPIPPDSWIDSLYAAHARARGQRGFAFGRIGARCRGHGAFDSTTPTGPWPDHRYTLHFTGDTFPTWGMLGFQVAFTVAEGSAGFPYVTHDLGSFYGRHLADELYVRWIQLGAFQPIFRVHSDHGDRLPWDYGEAARATATKFMQLRESLVPYLYTLGREAFDTGLPLTRGLYLSFPREENAYKYRNEYLLGDALLVMPIVAADNRAAVWFPPGTWTNVFTGERVVGPAEQTVTAALDTMPVFARAGAIVPRQPAMGHVGERPVDPLLVDVYGGGDGAFSLYEDEGEGLKYLDGKLRRTPLRWSDAEHVFTVEAASGGYDGAPPRRGYQLAFAGVAAPARVDVDGAALAAGQWRYDETKRTLTVDVPPHAVAQKLVVELR